MKKLFFLAIFLLSTWQVFAQVSLAPTAVFMDKNGIGTLYVTNNSAVPQEITISTEFGYPMQDANGALTMVYDDSINEKSHSLVPLVKIFPKTFILPAKQQQLVRFQVRAPKDLPAGMYFSRLKIASGAKAADVGAEQTTGGVTTRVNVVFEQVIAAFYKHGSVNTGLNANITLAQVDSNRLAINVNYSTTGNAPFIGKSKTILKDNTGNVLAEGSRSIALYFTGDRRLDIQVPELKSGEYNIEVLFETSRNDITAADLVTAPPVVLKRRIVVK